MKKRIISFMLVMVMLIGLMPTIPIASAQTSDKVESNVTWSLDGTVLTISGTGAMHDYSSDYRAPWGTGVTKVIIEDGVTSIGTEAFNNCTDLESVEIADSVTSIGALAFRYCDSLKNVVLPKQLKEVADYTFYCCCNLETITIPSTVTKIGAYAFNGCSDLSLVNFGGTAYQYAMIDIGQYDKSIVKAGVHTSDGVGGKCGKHLVWIKNGTKLSIYGEGEMYRYRWSSTLPWGTDITEVIIENGVTSIGEYAFYCCEELISVDIPDSVTSIEMAAFNGCSSLVSIKIPDSIECIEYVLFENCSSLTSITIPSSVSSISIDAFYGCENLKNVYITSLDAWYKIDFAKSHIYGRSDIYSNPLCYGANLYENNKLVTSVNIPRGFDNVGCVFSGCSSIVDVTLPDTIISIDDYAFYGCSSLESITIPDSVTSIGDYAFYGCSSLKSITIPDSIASIGNHTFSSCYSLESVTIPNSVTSIDSSAFSYCYSLESVTIPNSVTYIGDSAFYYCDSLKSVTIPNSVTSIGDYAFYSQNNDIILYGYKTCFGLVKYDSKHTNTISYLDATDAESIVGGKVGKITWSLDKRTGELIISGDGKIVDFTSANAPWDEYSGFITKVKISNGVTNIGDRAFYYCYNIESVTIPNSVTNIGDRAFYRCEDLEIITIPDSVTNIGDYAFYNCNSLEGVYITNIEAWCKIDFGYYSNPICYSGNLYLNDELVENLVIPDNITSIGDYAFYNCDSIKSISIPNSVTNIGYSAFYDCDSIESVTIPNSVANIGYEAFYDCDSIETIYIYSENCEFESNCGFNYNHTIYGFVGSTAQTFADDIGAEFIDVMTVHTHIYDDVTCKAPGCCKDCGCEIVIPHNFTGYVFDNNTKDGIGTESRRCVNCGMVIKRSKFVSIASCTNLTRAVLSTFIADFFDYDESMIYKDVEFNYSDVKESDVYAPAIEWCCRAGLVSGMGDGIFMPSNNITRAQLAVILVNLCERAGIELSSGDYSFEDSQSIPQWAKSYINKCLYNNIMTTEEGNVFAPYNNAVVADLSNIFNVLPDTTIDKNVKTAIMGGSKHIYTNACDAECNACGGIRSITHNYVDATCKAPKTCKICGIKSGSIANHKYDSGKVTKVATCKAAGTKIYKCTVCKTVIKTETISKTSHSYAVATCTKPKTCKVCGVTSGKALGHTYSNNADTSCNRCKAFSYPGGNTLYKVGTKYYHVVNRKIVKDTTLVNYGGKYLYVKNGVYTKATTLVNYGGKLLYVKGGVYTKATTLVSYGGKLLYVKGGVYTKATTLVKYGSKYYYVRNGVMNPAFSGKVKIATKTYTIKNGTVV